MTETASRDPNYVTTIMGVDLSTGRIPTKIYVDEVTHRLLVSSTITSPTTLVPGTDFDYIDGQQTSATVETYVYKLGGSGGATVQTIVVTYTDSSKSDIDSVEYS